MPAPLNAGEEMKVLDDRVESLTNEVTRLRSYLTACERGRNEYQVKAIDASASVQERLLTQLIADTQQKQAKPRSLKDSKTSNNKHKTNQINMFKTKPQT